MSKSSFKSNLVIAETGVISALIIAMTFVPYIGYISYGGLSITLIHIPVIIGACLLGIKGGITFGAVWGISCMLKALFAPPTPLEGILFKNPVVSVIPRILSGLAAAAIFILLKNHSKIKYILSVIIGCAVNTVFVMGSIYLLYGDKYGTELGISSVNLGGLTNYVLAAFGINAVIEIAVAIIITIPTVKAIDKKVKK